MDATDRALINRLQDGFPVCPRPFAEVAKELGIAEDDLIARISALRADGTLTRFGPLYNAERMGGALSLCALSVPTEDFERAAAIVNAFPEVAHNYEREDAYNMWFVLATGTPEDKARVLAEIEAAAGYPVLDLPKLEEYALDLRFRA